MKISPKKNISNVCEHFVTWHHVIGMIVIIGDCSTALLRMADHYRCDVIVRLFGARIREKEWSVRSRSVFCSVSSSDGQVVLKGLGVAHRLMREANIRIFQACTVFPIFSGLNNFLDERSTPGLLFSFVPPLLPDVFADCVECAAWGQSRFIREYAGYLEEKSDSLKVPF